MKNLQQEFKAKADDLYEYFIDNLFCNDQRHYADINTDRMIQFDDFVSSAPDTELSDLSEVDIEDLPQFRSFVTKGVAEWLCPQKPIVEMNDKEFDRFCAGANHSQKLIKNFNLMNLFKPFLIAFCIIGNLYGIYLFHEIDQSLDRSADIIMQIEQTTGHKFNYPFLKG